MVFVQVVFAQVVFAQVVFVRVFLFRRELNPTTPVVFSLQIIVLYYRLYTRLIVPYHHDPSNDPLDNKPLLTAQDQR